MRKLRLRVLSFLFSISFIALSADEAAALRRVALVIGNAKYEHAGVLANTLNDARAMAALFRRAGFDVVDERIDVGVVSLKRAIRDFTGVASNADIAVIYYSGHGIEVSGVNYLIPTDAKLADAYDVEDETLPLDRLILATSGVKSLSLIILDACRENPFLRNGAGPVSRAVSTHTLAEQPTAANTLIAYAAKAGSLSFDGIGPNSPFTTALVRHIAEPGLDVRIALGKVRDDVLEATGRRQEPYVYGSLGGAAVSLVPAAEPANVAADPLAATAADYAAAERAGTPEAWRAFIALHNEGGFYVELARAQFNRVATAQPAPTPTPTVVAVATPAPEPPQPSPTPTRVAALPAPAPAPADPCVAEAARLSALRNAAAPEAIAAFSREMTCAALRPQVKRLVDSLTPNAAPTPSPTPTRLASRNPDAGGCEGERRELERLRAEPDAAQAKAFYGRLVCASLRPQVARLMESLGETPPPAAVGASQRGPHLTATATDDPATCAQESGALARLRANPSHSAAQAFADELRCRTLKPQAERLLESLSD